MSRARVGDRVQITDVMPDDPAPLPIGTTGVVSAVFDEGGEYEQYDVEWDIDRSLMLLPGDPFAVIGTEESHIDRLADGSATVTAVYSERSDK